MQVKRIPGGTWRILMSDRELTRFGVSFSALQEGDSHTETAIRRILTAVCAKAEMPTGTVLTVEAAPVDGGCLLLITPHMQGSVYIFSLEDAGALLSMAAGIRRLQPDDEVASSSLYVMDGGYRLLLYGTPTPDHLAQLMEFAQPTGSGTVSAAKITEYGKAVFVGNALQQLSELTV